MSERWQTRVVELKPTWLGRHEPDVLQEQLNTLGLDGWELVNVVSINPMMPLLAFLRRPLP